MTGAWMTNPMTHDWRLEDLMEPGARAAAWTAANFHHNISAAAALASLGNAVRNIPHAKDEPADISAPGSFARQWLAQKHPNTAVTS